MKSKKESYNPLWIAGSNSKFKLSGAKPTGFWVGFWHGIVASIVFIVGFFTPKVGIYETNNNGKWYDFGFLLGVGGITVGAKNTSGQ